jgi:flagellar biogenesis protein FliO
MKSFRLLRSFESAGRPRTVAAMLVLTLTAGTSLGADHPAAGLPVPPDPEDVSAGPVAVAGDHSTAVRPAAFDQAPAPAREPAGPLPLSPASEPGRDRAAAAERVLPLGDWTLLLAIGGAFAILAIFRLRTLKQWGGPPPEVFELLGTASLGGQQTARIVRFGPRTLLIGVSSAGCQTLAVLDDADSTERIVAACRSERLAARPPFTRGVTAAHGPTAGGRGA